MAKRLYEEGYINNAAKAIKRKLPELTQFTISEFSGLIDSIQSSITINDEIYIDYSDYELLSTKDPNTLYITTYGSTGEFKGPLYLGETLLYKTTFFNYDFMLTKSIITSNYSGFDTSIDLHTSSNINRGFEFIINFGSIPDTGKRIIIGNEYHDDPYFWFWTESGKLRMTLDGNTVLNLESDPSTNVDYKIIKEATVSGSTPTISVYKGSTLLNSYNWDTSYVGNNPVRIGNAYGHGYYIGTLNYLGFKWTSD